MPDALTQRQDAAYEFIRSYHRAHRKPPTYTEIGQALGIRSLNAVVKVLRALEAKGYLTRTPNVARGLTLSAPDDPYALDGDTVPQLPLLKPATTEDPEALFRRLTVHLAVDQSLLPRAADPEQCFAGRVGDDGMNPEGIRKHDLIVIERGDADALRNGDLAAVLLGEQLLVRRFERANGRLHFRAADTRRYTDEAFAPGDPKCYVVGRVTALLRKLI